MTENFYLPEGMLINTRENKEYISSLSGLERAWQTGKILESRVLMCDSDYNLVFELGGYRAIIPREEAAWTEDGSECRDIAVITRVGKPAAFKIMNIIKDKSGEPLIIMSRKRAQEDCVIYYLNTLETGDVIDAHITHIEPFGCFCDIGCGIISLLSIDCISVSRISHPEDRFRRGQYIKAVVKSRDLPMGSAATQISKGRIALSHKELLGTWRENAERFSIGQTVSGIVRSIESYGIFVELAPNLAGLAEWKAGVEIGQSAAVYIKNIIPSKKKVKLVIIDSYACDNKGGELEYFVSDGNLADWVY